ncbi:MAG: DMT family transporter [Clostridiales bacterium]|nr:DMT family transporter [Candidatus Equinaster intestinalis]
MNKSKIYLILSMLIFGSIGIFRTYIPIGSAVLAVLRGFIGAISIIVIMLITGKKIDFAAIKKNLFLLILSGVFVGFNWMLLFEAYIYTTVSVATLCYYMAPIFVIIVSPFLLDEKMTLKKIICVIVAALGMAFVSGALGESSKANVRGVLFGLGAAVMYAGIIVCNKKIKGVDFYSKTAIQLFVASVSVLPYALKGGELPALSAGTIALIIIVGVVHTGIAYALYFASMDGLTAQTVAIFSYIDPAVAVLSSVVILCQPFTLMQLAGVVLILGASCVSEIKPKIKE